MYKLLLIALGGAVGTLARYGTGTLLATPSARVGFPFGTLAVNLVGCFIMGLLQGYFPRSTRAAAIPAGAAGRVSWAATRRSPATVGKRLRSCRTGNGAWPPLNSAPTT